MGRQIKLKDSALAFLLEELEKGEMLAIYLMASGVEMTDKVTKAGMVIKSISICFAILQLTFSWTQATGHLAVSWNLCNYIRSLGQESSYFDT